MSKIRTRCIIGLLVGLMCTLFCGCGNGETEQNNINESEVMSEEQSESVTENKTEPVVEKDWAALFKGMEYTKAYKGILDTNPIMTQRFGADPYAMVYGDRVYFYMTADAFEYDAKGEVKENTYSSIRSLNVVSTDDMMNFTDHGSIQVAGANGAASKWAHNSWAPAACWKNIDGKDKFFLYFADNGGGIGVLTSDSPVGPFEDPLGEGLITRKTPNCANVLWLFDPAVLVDDDGRAYLYFGGGVPEGRVSDPGTARVVELGDDMISIKGEPQPIDVPYLFEDSGIHKYGNKYYYTYCSNWQVDAESSNPYGMHNAEIISMESDSPMGPFVFKERILENPGKLCGLYGNNHHCVFSFQDRWYITYHSRMLEKAMKIEKGYRATCIDEFKMGEDGTIGIIKQTKDGREQLKYVNPYEEHNATTMAMNSGLGTVSVTEGGKEFMVLSDISNGDYLKVQGVDFGATAPVAIEGEFRLIDESKPYGVVRVSLDTPGGMAIGYLPMELLESEKSEAGFVKCRCQLPEEFEGVHDVFFTFYNDGYEMKSWKFIAGENAKKEEAVTNKAEEMVVQYCPKTVSAPVEGREYGKVEHITYQSKTCGMERGANVLLPSDYSADKKYPVIYFQHGIFGDENSLIYDPNLHLAEIIGNLAADGQAKDAIVVFPNMYATTDANMQPGFDEVAIAPYDNFINDLVNDLIPYIEANYSVSAKKEDRAIVGFSMGGRETLFVGLSRPDLFSAVAAISPAPGLVPGQDYNMVHKGQLAEENAKYALDDKPDLLMVCCGNVDGVVGKFPKSYHELFEKNGVEHLWYEILGADHDDKAIRSGFYNFLIRWK